MSAAENIRSKTFTIELTPRPDISGRIVVDGQSIRSKLESILNAGLQIGIDDFLIWLNVLNEGSIYESAFTIELRTDTYVKLLDVAAAVMRAIEDEKEGEHYVSDLLIFQISTKLVSMRPRNH